MRLLVIVFFLLFAAIHGVIAAWEYSVVCPPPYAPTGVNGRSRCDVIILADEEPATVTITTADSTQTVTVEQEYRWTAENLAVAGGIEEKGIIFSSDVPIAIYLAQIDEFNVPQLFNDATGITAVSSSQTSFHIVNHANAPDTCGASSRLNDFFAISSSTDNNYVTVTSPTSSPSSFTLNRFETYSEIAPRNVIELSGYKITSSLFPVTVVSGNLCTFSSSLAAGSYITSQTPVAKYGTMYVVPAIKAPLDSGYDVHVVASVDDTVVDINGQLSVLEADEILVRTFPGNMNATLVTCSLPCNVLQFTNGDEANEGMFVIDVIPRNEFYTRAIFTTSEENDDHHITVIVDSPTPVDDILLDGDAFLPEWSIAGDFIYTTADVGAGYHVMISTDSRFAVYTYAHTGHRGGGYGFAVLPAVVDTSNP